MKKINPENSSRRRSAQLLIGDKALRNILEGGTWQLEQGEDFEGTIGAADALVRDILKARMGTWQVRQDKKNGTITITVHPPTP